MPKVVKSSAREIILKVKEFCEAERRNQGVLIPLNNVRKRVAAMTGVSEKTVTRITKEGVTAASTSKKIVTPGKRRPHPKKYNLDEFDLCAIRRKIRSYYKVHKELPTLAKLRAALREEINFQGSVTTLYRLLDRFGFKYKRSQSKLLTYDEMDLVSTASDTDTESESVCVNSSESDVPIVVD